MSDPTAARFRSGLAYGLVAYTCWGMVPLYFNALGSFNMPAWEILAHRIAWSLPVMALLTAILGGGRDLLRVLRSRKLVLVLLLSAVFLALNWMLYIYATVQHRVTEASLGYYMLPLVNAAFATLFLGEKLRPAHYPALTLIVIGVAIPCLAVGYLPWIAVALPITFGLYGLVRKQAPVESMTGLTVETLLMLPPSLGFLMYLSANAQNHMTPNDWGLNALIAFSGIVTVVPLLTFTLSLRRLPLLAISFIQFVSPTVQVLIAVFWLGERDKLTPETVAAFACVWSAVALFVCDALWQARHKHGKLKPAPINLPVPGTVLRR
ncbi:EamA family transporter RarD [Frigoriglobus tundricola]|uniref:Putative inner membrane protein RarD n=1 Tax=Frigoriglobus tundricola TaxID=2774151 RepID=A0A6M5Z2B5_9BACT|nr:EamA family transporter RarD [Frigoriglobus tundricola]QJX00206.1 putative inner membrane protein RarD [Frigoriglobus tundricola]